MTVTDHRRHRSSHPITLLVLLALVSVLSGCALALPKVRHAHPPRVLRLAVIFPVTGVDGPLGRALEHGVELAVRQHHQPGRGYRLVLVHLDEARLSPGLLQRVLRTRDVVGIVGILDDAGLPAVLPAIERQRIPVISPVSLLPHLPPGSGGQNGSGRAVRTSFFPLAVSDQVAGKAAADAAVALAAPAGPAVFLTDDGTRPGRALADSFAAELRRRSGVIAGRRSIAMQDPTNVQRAVSAIIEADPSLVFYAGGTAAGADLRRTLSGTGAPLLRMLTAGPIVGHPGWAAAAGGGPLSARTLGILPVPDLSALPRAKQFLSAYHHAFPGEVLLPQTVVAYDAATDEIRAMSELIRAGKPVTRPALARRIAGTTYRGISGALSFDAAGRAASLQFHLYATDLNGRWRDQGPVK